MSQMNKATREALWAKVQPALERAWAAYEQLHGIPVSTWPDQERNLFNLNPRLYRDYRNGLTPAQERGRASADLQDQVGTYVKRWGIAVLAEDLAGYPQGKP